MYRVVNCLAPKRRRDQVRIRSTQGYLLTVKQEFDEIYQYFSTAFARDEEFRAPQSTAPLVFSEEETLQAIRQLKTGKSVPATSVPADVWLLCPVEVALFCARVFNNSNIAQYNYPSEVTGCELSLLPKPGKTGRRPQDLRPLGLQDPCSKTLAIVRRARAEACVSDCFAARPQFARDRLQRGHLSVHDKRTGARESGCYGGLMVSVDLSRALDQLPRTSLDASVAYAGVPSELREAVLSFPWAAQPILCHAERGETGLCT